MKKKFAPMLASQADTALLRYPLLLSPKYDGIRAVVLGGKLLSRKLKPIPNDHIQKMFETVNQLVTPLEGLDGELIVGDPTAKNCFQATTSGVMKKTGEPDFKFYVFDKIADGPYHERFVLSKALPAWVKCVPQIVVHNAAELDQAEERYVTQGYEGIMLRDPDGAYKYGRSTAKEGLLLKVKRFEDDEGTIIGFEEKEHNGNKAERDELGHTKRSSAKAGKSGAGTLGTLLLASSKWPDPVRVGTGLDDKLRADIWKSQRSYLGRLVKFRYQAVGTKDMPRCPAFVGFRDARDL